MWLCDVVGLLWCGGENGLDVDQVNDARDGVMSGWCGEEEQGGVVLGEGPHEERCMGR